MESVTPNVMTETKLRGCNPSFVVTSDGVVVIDVGVDDDHGEDRFHHRGRHSLAERFGRAADRKPFGSGDQADKRKSENSFLHHAPPAHAFARKTDSEIEFGNGLVFSKMPSNAPRASSCCGGWPWRKRMG